jgi:hypothetical protein
VNHPRLLGTGSSDRTVSIDGLCTQVELIWVGTFPIRTKVAAMSSGGAAAPLDWGAASEDPTEDLAKAAAPGASQCNISEQDVATRSVASPMVDCAGRTEHAIPR